MKIFTNLCNEIISTQNLFLAWKVFRRGKTKKKDVMQFEWELEQNIFALHRSLEQKKYRHGTYKGFYVTDPKRRHIHKAIVRDRVLHHAIYNKLYPLFDPIFIATSFSCRINKGTHRGVLCKRNGQKKWGQPPFMQKKWGQPPFMLNRHMPRINRVDVGGEVYHVLNRANARVQIFDNTKDYKQFEDILEEAVEKFDMRLLAYCIMPNHWHLVLFPKTDGEMQGFMSRLTNTHTRRWHVSKNTVGQGHLYQGRYKSFICKKDQYLLTLLRYVERNAKRANLVKKAEDWQWSSVWRREKGTLTQRKTLSEWPIDFPKNYLSLLNGTLTTSEEESLARSEEKSVPYGADSWVTKIVKKYKIEQVLKGVGRPKNGG